MLILQILYQINNYGLEKIWENEKKLSVWVYYIVFYLNELKS